MTVCYLEPDDEITGAIARLRAVKDGEAVIVVPPGSRIATSRINFKLLVREGNELRLNIAAVSDDPAVRALAIAAGLPAYDSVPAAEQALVNFREQDRRLAERLGRDPGDATVPTATRPRIQDQTEGTQVMSTPPVSRTSASTNARAAERQPAGRAGQDRSTERRRIGTVPILAAVVVLVLLAGVAYGAYTFLPTATITLSPATTTFDPGDFTITANPDIGVADVASGVVPAERLEIPLSFTAEYAATGVMARETRATGTVRFRSENTLNEVPVIEGTVVSTADGIDFETIQAAVIPRADFQTSTPGMVDVPVRAVRAGTRGNVAAETIVEVSPGLRNQLVSVRNPDATDGGRRIEEAVIQQSDYDGAVADLNDKLEVALADALRDPATTPSGLTLFFTSAQIGSPLISQPATAVVGTAAATFQLTITSTGTATAVNETLVDDLAEERLRSLLPSSQVIAGDDVTASHSVGTVVAETVTYEASAAAPVYTEPDRVSLTDVVRGKSIPEARSILSAYGMVEIAIWPDFVDRLPDQTARINLVVLTPSPRP